MLIWCQAIIGYLVLLSVPAFATNSGLDGWLGYDPLEKGSFDPSSLPRAIHVLTPNHPLELERQSVQTDQAPWSSFIRGLPLGSPIVTAREELKLAFRSLFDVVLDDNALDVSSLGWKSTVVIGTYSSYAHRFGSPGNSTSLKEDGFYISSSPSRALILGSNDRAVLYGTFTYLSRLAQSNFSSFDLVDNPSQPIRWVNQWDNLDGTIERGYAGPSIFFDDGHVVSDLSRVKQYGRLLASVGYNALVVNNVNTQAELLLPSNIRGLGRIADQLRPFGIQVGISINFDSPRSIGHLSTSDPLDHGVISWWNSTVDALYASVPDLAGFVVKANSEGQPGPLTYNRTFSEGANLFARALAPHGGICMFRAFVYTQEPWSDPKSDRARQAVEFFADQDGKFDDNVVVQIKYGPIDFQVDEPPSPLFATLRNSNMALEIQVSQEYLGQQSHFVYLAPLWKKILDFDMRLDGKSTPVRDLVSGKATNRKLGGIAVVVNVGMNDTWLGAHLAMVNLYASGRFAWDPSQSAEEVLDSWTRLTWGSDEQVVNELHTMGIGSWATHRDYTGVLGTLSPAATFTHYGPNPETNDGPSDSRWFRADKYGVGFDRSVKTGTGFAAQYPAQVAEMLEVVDTTPEDLVLFFHHLPYNHSLKSGKTVIQTIYDAHYDGSARANRYADQWRSLRGKIDKERYESVLFQLEHQGGHAVLWRDAMVNWYHNKSGISDIRERSDGWKIEAESMTLGGEPGGYVPYAADPWFTASNATAMILSSNATGNHGSLWTTLDVPHGSYDISVNYFDLSTGQAKWTVYLEARKLDQWIGNNEWALGHVASPYVDGHSATRRTIRGVKVRCGDVIKVVGETGGGDGDPAPLDYVLLTPRGG